MGCGSSHHQAVADGEGREAPVKQVEQPPEKADSPKVAYCGAQCPLNEPSRIKHLHDLNILDTASEERYDVITRLCCTAFRVPIALVSLVDTDRQWFKSEQGLDGARQTDRASSFCAWTLLPAYPEALVVEDAQLDARFRENPLVQGFPFIRFYAGCPLVTSAGLRLGSLCIIDRAPRVFDAESCALLANMAEMVVREIEQDMVKDAQVKAVKEGAQVPRPIDVHEDAVMVVNTAGAEDWSIVYANAACQRLLGDGSGAASFWSVFQAVDPRGRPSATATAAVQRAYGRAVRERRNFELKVVYSRGGGKTEDGGGAGNGGSGGGGERSGLVEFRFAPNTGVDEHMQLIGIPNFLPDAAEPPSYYFALLRELGPAAAAPPGGAPPSPAPPRRPSVDAGAAPPALAPAASGPFASRLGTGDSGSGTASSNYLGDAYKLLPNNDVFADIRLGPLLGKGSFGRVYRASWSGQQVAVKLIEYLEDPDGRAIRGSDASDSGSSASGGAGGGGAAPGGARRGTAVFEGLLQERISHKNVVRNYKLFTRPMPGGACSDDGGSSEGGGSDDGGGEGVRGAFALPPARGASPACGAGAGHQAVVPSDGFAASGAAAARPRGRAMEAWLILEFCNRGCVADAIDKGWFRRKAGMFEPAVRAILATAREVAEAMEYLHSQGILHGDLTSANVLLASPPEGEAPPDPRGFVAKVSDFGLSRTMGPGNEDGVVATRTYGTVTHMPPELLLEGRLSKAADVYSFGVVLWEMLQGGRPFPGLSHSQVLHAVSQGRALSPPKATPATLAPLLAACLARAPEARPRFPEVVTRLAELEGGFPW